MDMDIIFRVVSKISAIPLALWDKSDTGYGTDRRSGLEACQYLDEVTKYFAPL